jgi:hypothetical protein
MRAASSDQQRATNRGDGLTADKRSVDPANR